MIGVEISYQEFEVICMLLLFNSTPFTKAIFLPWKETMVLFGFQANANLASPPEDSTLSRGLEVMKGR